jgi:intracellular sulfur oxidation DsrE/DsrF family protein
MRSFTSASACSTSSRGRRKAGTSSGRRAFLAGLCLLAGAAPFVSQAQAQQPPVRAVYHFGEGIPQALRGLQYIRNHLEADPNAQIVAVTHAAGVDFLMKGAKTERGNELRGPVEDLDLAGVKFRVCEITLRERNLRRDQFLPLVEFVPSGVAEIARLQSREGFAYLRP